MTRPLRRRRRVRRLRFLTLTLAVDKLKAIVEPTLKLMPLVLPVKPAPPTPASTVMVDAKKEERESDEEPQPKVRHTEPSLVTIERYDDV